MSLEPQTPPMDTLGIRSLRPSLREHRCIELKASRWGQPPSGQDTPVFLDPFCVPGRG